MMKHCLVLAGVMCLVACNSANLPPSEINNPTTPSIGAGTVTFPHPDAYSAPQSHGGEVAGLGFDTTACKTCHGANLEGANGPACATCHTLYPHAQGWAQPSNHGAHVLANGQKACATQCHGSDLNGGLSGVACADCHQGYPHPNGWKDPTAHGLFVKNTYNFSTTACTECHTGDASSTAPSCTSCHALYPHAEGWEAASMHGDVAKTNGTNQCATFCHGTDLAGGNSGVSCNKCHSYFPHQAGWATTSIHGETTRDLGTTACTGCHTLSTDATSFCATCHKSLPAHFLDTNWNSSNHGPYVFANNAIASGECAKCHGATLEGGSVSADATVPPEPSCAACHTAYPVAHAKPAWMTNSPTTQYAGHGEVVVSLNGAGKNDDTFNSTAYDSQCASCHGNTQSIGPSTGPNINPYNTLTSTIAKGSTTIPTCYNCHVYPHPNVTINGKLKPWKGYHPTPLLTTWANNGNDNLIDEKTCGMNGAGCHRDGPVKTTPLAIPGSTPEVQACNLCHTFQ